MAKVITFTPPLDVPTGLACTLSVGGDLAPDTTYYYSVIAFSKIADVRFAGSAQSPMCTQVSITTTATNKTVDISWDAVVGAGAYVVLRSTISGNFDGRYIRFRRLTNNSSSYTTTDLTGFADDGNWGMYYTDVMQAMPSGSPCPGNLDMTSYGLGILSFTGGTDADPITLQNIYDYFVSSVANYGRYITWDGVTAVLLGSFFISTGLETHFRSINEHLIIVGAWNIYATNANSNIQFGEISPSAYNYLPYHGTRISFIGTRGGKSGAGKGASFYNVKYVNLNYVGTTDNTNWTNGTLWCLGANYLFMNYMKGLGRFSADEFGYFNYSGTNNDLYAPDLTIATFAEFQSRWNGKTAEGWQMYYAQTMYNGDNLTLRYDRFTMTHYYGWRVRQAYNNHHKAIDCTYTNPLFNGNNIPTINWGDTTGLDNCVLESFNTLKVKVVDASGNPIEGASVTITDVNGDPALDSDLEGITGWLTNPDGCMLVESFSETSGGSNLLFTDSSKSMVVDAVKGRNFWLTNGELTIDRLKVLSNSSNALTFVKESSDDFAIGNRGGIIPEIRIDHNISNGTRGTNETIRTAYSPFTITVTADAYSQYSAILDINSETSLMAVMRLAPVVDDPTPVFYHPEVKGGCCE